MRSARTGRLTSGVYHSSLVALPDRIGRFEVLGYLAAGGMAELYLCRLSGPAGFSRPVVVKRILPHLARDEEFRDMFLDEARIMARVRHPNVVSVLELGEDDGELFFALEYLEGESLATLMKTLAKAGEGLDTRFAGRILIDLLDGLHAVHELRDEEGNLLDVVHRDISPQNVFITYDGQVKLLDFGVASYRGRSHLTTTGQIKGKFAYMAPEQCRALPVDRRSDVFAVGVVAWELLSGRRLYKRENELLTWKAIVEEEAPPLPGAPHLAPIVAKALAREPVDRHASAAELRLALSEAEPGVDRLELAALMARAFSDRAEEKRGLLSSVRAGRPVLSIPPPELPSDGIEVLAEAHTVVPSDTPPSLSSLERISNLSPRTSDSKGRARAPWGMGTVAVVLLGGLAGIAFLSTTDDAATDSYPTSAHGRDATVASDDEAPRATEATGSPDSIEASSSSDSIEATDPSDPSEVPGSPSPVDVRPTRVEFPSEAPVRLSLRSTPSGARAFDPDGEELCQTPCDLELPRARLPTTLTFRRRGFVDRTLDVLPTSNELILEVALIRTTPRRPPTMDSREPEFFRID